MILHTAKNVRANLVLFLHNGCISSSFLESSDLVYIEEFFTIIFHIWMQMFQFGLFMVVNRGLIKKLVYMLKKYVIVLLIFLLK